MANFTLILMYVAAFLAMFLAADFAKRTAANSFAAGISSTVLRTLVTSFVWGLTASVVGTVVMGLFGMAAPFMSWLIFFTLIDFVFGLIRSKTGR